MKRKIIHIVYSLGYGGLEQVIVNLINNSTHYNVEHCIITLTGEHELYKTIIPKVEIYNLNKKPGKDILVYWKLFKHLKKIKADVIHSYNFGTIEYHLIAKIAGIKTRVHCEHGRGGDDPDGLDFWHNIVRRIAIIFIHQFIVVSPDLLVWGKKVLKLKKNKIRVIFNGVNLDEYQPSHNKNTHYTICTVGRANPIKNQRLLIDAFALLVEQYPEYKQHQLQIVGGGSLLEELTSQVKDRQLEDQITLLGYKNNVATIMGQANLFVLSSIYEAMPMTILEAMACELPVITTDVGGVGHMVSNNEVWLVESNNVEILAGTIHQVYSYQKTSEAKGKRGRAYVEKNYSIEKMVSQYMSLYQCSIIKPVV